MIRVNRWPAALAFALLLAASNVLPGQDAPLPAPESPLPFYVVDDAPAPPPEEEVFPNQAAMINATYGGYGWRCCDHCRAGWPTCIRKHAIPSNTRHYCGYYVGGGAAWHGEGRFIDEGTFGWDYMGIIVRKRVALDWYHGRRYQGGDGAYETEGPKLKHE